MTITYRYNEVLVYFPLISRAISKDDSIRDRKCALLLYRLGEKERKHRYAVGLQNERGDKDEREAGCIKTDTPRDREQKDGVERKRDREREREGGGG